MGMLDVMAERLRVGAVAVTFAPRGHSMEPLIADGQTVTVMPLNGQPLTVGDIVLVTVRGRTRLHKILALDGDRIQIGNNKGHVNGWAHVSKVWGRYDG